MQYFHLQMQVQNGFILIKMILRVRATVKGTLEDRVSFLSEKNQS